METKGEKVYGEFLEASKRTGVPIKKVLDVFWHLSQSGSIANDDLLRRVGVSKNALNQVKQALSSYLGPATSETVLMTKAAEELKSFYNSDYMIEEALLKTIEGDIYRQLIQFLDGCKANRPEPKRQYDQFTATIETTARRVSLLNFFGDITGKKLLFLGDDDFTSVATANLGTAQHITVVDIDDSILHGIGDISTEHNLNIGRLKYDARRPLPNVLKDKFDVVFTDPPYTPEGIKLFVSRAIGALDKANEAARIYVCYGNSDRAKERFLPIQEVITYSGLMVRWLFDKFNRYQGAESIGSSSSLYITETTPKTRPLVKGNYDKPIYTLN